MFAQRTHVDAREQTHAARLITNVKRAALGAPQSGVNGNHQPGGHLRVRGRGDAETTASVHGTKDGSREEVRGRAVLRVLAGRTRIHTRGVHGADDLGASCRPATKPRVRGWVSMTRYTQRNAAAVP